MYCTSRLAVSHVQSSAGAKQQLLLFFVITAVKKNGSGFPPESTQLLDSAPLTYSENEKLYFLHPCVG